MRREFQAIFDQHFKYLIDEFGYQITRTNYDPLAFGNFVIELSKGERKLKLTSDRSQIFVEIYEPSKSWIDKEQILDAIGIPRSRFSSPYGLWSGYEIQNQSVDLKQHARQLNL